MVRPSVKALRLIATFSVPIALGACALPVPLQVASLVADGISYMTTNKSITDHGLSAVVGKDCALLRGVQGNTLCRDEAGEIDVEADAVAADKDAPVTDSASFAMEPAPATTPVEAAVLPAPDLEQTVATVPTAVPAPPPVLASNPDDGLYLIIGSFVKEGDALRHARNHEGLVPKIIHGKVKGVPVYRVGLGPLVGDGLANARDAANALGIYDAWAVRVTLAPDIASVPAASVTPERQAYNVH